ncbi:chaplin [Streptomonospora sp. S1-112]|uniref:Chaplin n=1 Tax=Streptomonospora mangrovi TaxID=2883123 RepID=A0A9X3NH06_9ACTN|nr:chaplin family protein [Streptomonospora mangrovi]MDA0563554.1 chaplin [Streptomonospora mangrovi]
MLKKTLVASAIAAAAAGAFIAGAPAASAEVEQETSGNGSILGGNQLGLDLNVPVNVCGNSVAIIGVAGADCDHSGAVVKN